MPVRRDMSPRRSGSAFRQTETDRAAVYELIHPEPGESFRWHRHDYPAPIARWNHHPEYELHLITHGTGRVIIGDHVGLFQARQLVLVGPNLPHAWFSATAPDEIMHGRDIVLQFSAPWIDGLVSLCPELNGIRPMLDASCAGLEFTGDKAACLGEAFEQMGMLRGVARLTACIDLLAGLARCPWRQIGVAPAHPTTQWSRPRRKDMHKMGALIHDLLASDPATIRHETLARVAGLTPSAFSRQFRAATGGTFMDFLQKLRISHACHLLSTSDQSITDICMASGFMNLSNFNRTFRRLRHCTPRDYRQQFKELIVATPDDSTVPER